MLVSGSTDIFLRWWLRRSHVLYCFKRFQLEPQSGLPCARTMTQARVVEGANGVDFSLYIILINFISVSSELLCHCGDPLLCDSWDWSLAAFVWCCRRTDIIWTEMNIPWSPYADPWRLPPYHLKWLLFIRANFLHWKFERMRYYCSKQRTDGSDIDNTVTSECEWGPWNREISWSTSKTILVVLWGIWRCRKAWHI